MSMKRSRLVLLLGRPGWVLPGASLDLDFANGRAFNGSVTEPTSLLTVSRGSTAYIDDLAGNWTSFGNNVLRISNKGALIEESRTNSVRNNSMQGVVAGTPGTNPTNWSFDALSGLTKTIVGTGTENGVDYIDVQWSGTTSAPISGSFFRFETSTQIAALQGQTWTESVFLKLVAGSLTGVTVLKTDIVERDSGGALLTETLGASLLGLTGTLTRFSVSATLATATAAFVQPVLSISIPTSTAVDFTIRFGWPDLELNSGLNSTLASATIAAAGSGGTNGAQVVTVVGGTGTAATVNVTVTGGVITAVNSIATPGSYSVFPTSPAAVTGASLVGATLNLVPTNNAASGFASSPIRTTAGAIQRFEDVVTLTLGSWFNVAAGTMYAEAMIPVFPADARPYEFYLDGNNLIHARLTSSGGQLRQVAVLGGVTQVAQNTANGMTAGVVWKQAQAWAAADFVAVLNNGTLISTASGAVPTGLTTLALGSGNAGAQPLDGYLRRIGYFTSRLPNARLQTLST